MAKIKQLLLNLTEKVERLKDKISDMDNRLSTGLNDANEIKFIKVIITFIYYFL